MDLLLEKITSKKAHIVVVGIGYVGLPLVVEFARSGFRVTGFDRDVGKVSAINNGTSYIEDISAKDFAPHVKSGMMNATVDESVIGKADCVILCVPTPLKKTKDPDMSYIEQAAEAVARHQHKGMLVVLESTTYPGTTREVLVRALTSSDNKVGKDVFIAFSPERVDPGNKHFQTHNTPKVVGGTTPSCLALAKALYSQVIQTIVPVSSTDAAEMVKLIENTYRAVNIGLANEFALICERLGINVWEVIQAAATKPFGFMPFYPGPGLGGHCIPIDPLYLSWKLRALKMSARFIELADIVNGSMPEHVVELTTKALNSAKKAMNGSKILVSGVAYKRDISDVRESPAMDVIHGLKARGAEIAYVDPWVPYFNEHNLSMEGVNPNASFAGYDCIVIVTDHATVDYARMVREAALIVDTRNVTQPFANQSGAQIIRL